MKIRLTSQTCKPTTQQVCVRLNEANQPAVQIVAKLDGMAYQEHVINCSFVDV